MADYGDFDCDIYMREREREKLPPTHPVHIYACILCSSRWHYGLWCFSSQFLRPWLTSLYWHQSKDWLFKKSLVYLWGKKNCFWCVIGADWHASLPSDNNHCTRGDLPDFLRNLYDKCRGPPRLFLLDKYGPTRTCPFQFPSLATITFFLRRWWREYIWLPVVRPPSPPFQLCVFFLI